MANKTRRKEIRTYRDRAHYLVLAVAKRRRRVKELAIQLKGGKCQICGYCKYQGHWIYITLMGKNPLELAIKAIQGPGQK